MINFKFVLLVLVSLTCIMTNSVMAGTAVEPEPVTAADVPTLSTTLDIDIPSLTYTTPTVSLDLIVKLEFSHSEDDKYYWVLSELDQRSDAVIEGKEIYNKTCILCHTVGGVSSINSSNPKTIRAAMLTNTGGMGQLNYLTDTDLENIAEYIKTVIGSTPATTVEIGRSIYDKTCLACHALGTPSSEGSLNPNTIRAAILTDTGGMSRLAYLSDSDLEAVADYIDSITPTSSSIFDIFFNSSSSSDTPSSSSDTPSSSSDTPSSPTTASKGKNFYDDHCLACHALGTSASNKSSDSSVVSSAIINNIGGMDKLSFLSTSDLDDIAAYIKQLP